MSSTGNARETAMSRRDKTISRPKKPDVTVAASSSSQPLPGPLGARAVKMAQTLRGPLDQRGSHALGYREKV